MTFEVRDDLNNLLLAIQPATDIQPAQYADALVASAEGWSPEVLALSRERLLSEFFVEQAGDEVTVLKKGVSPRFLPQWQKFLNFSLSLAELRDAGKPWGLLSHYNTQPSWGPRFQVTQANLTEYADYIVSSMGLKVVAHRGLSTGVLNAATFQTMNWGDGNSLFKSWVDNQESAYHNTYKAMLGTRVALRTIFDTARPIFRNNGGRTYVIMPIPGLCTRWTGWEIPFGTYLTDAELATAFSGCPDPSPWLKGTRVSVWQDQGTERAVWVTEVERVPGVEAIQLASPTYSPVDYVPAPNKLLSLELSRTLVVGCIHPSKEMRWFLQQIPGEALFNLPQGAAAFDAPSTVYGTNTGAARVRMIQLESGLAPKPAHETIYTPEQIAARAETVRTWCVAPMAMPDWCDIYTVRKDEHGYFTQARYPPEVLQAVAANNETLAISSSLVAPSVYVEERSNPVVYDLPSDPLFGFRAERKLREADKTLARQILIREGSETLTIAQAIKVRAKARPYKMVHLVDTLTDILSIQGFIGVVSGPTNEWVLDVNFPFAEEVAPEGAWLGHDTQGVQRVYFKLPRSPEAALMLLHTLREDGLTFVTTVINNRITIVNDAHVLTAELMGEDTFRARSADPFDESNGSAWFSDKPLENQLWINLLQGIRSELHQLDGVAKRHINQRFRQHRQQQVAP